MLSIAKDDAERSRIYARLYAPPRPARPRRASAPRGTTGVGAGGGMSRGQAEALMAQFNASDAQAPSRRGAP